MKKKIIILGLSIAAYLIVKHVVPYGYFFLYPLILLVTILHELGHALFALLTGGAVHGVQINPDGSGHAQVSGGWIALVAMGGYVGSAILGNLLVLIGMVGEKWARIVPYFLAALFIFTGVWWYQQIFSSVVLFLFAAGFIWASKNHPKRIAAALVFIGSTSVLYIVEDINSGPRSDLAVFTRSIPILPQFVWAALWLLLVLIITVTTLRHAFHVRTKTAAITARRV